MDEEQADWFVGVDWASQTHHLVLIDARGRKVAERGFQHGGEGMADMVAWIGKHTGSAPEGVRVAIEVPHGPIVEGLMERGSPVHSINPKQLDRFRDRFSPAGAKTIAAMPRYWRARCEPIRAVSAVWSRSIRSSSSCASGRVSPRI